MSAPAVPQCQCGWPMLPSCSRCSLEGRPCRSTGCECDRATQWPCVPFSENEKLAEIEKLELIRSLEIAKSQGSLDPWFPWEHQVVPTGDWYLWLMLAGRGAGKTDACAYYFDKFMRNTKGARGGIVGPTIGDAVEACVTGASGLMIHNPNVKIRSRVGGTFVLWPNGSEAKLFGTHTKDDVDRLRAGGNRHIYWAEELAAWRYFKEAWENMELGLRLGSRPHVIGSTTPKPRPHLKKLMQDHETVLVTATTYDNPKLPARQLTRLKERYEGTRTGRQELLGEYLEDVEGALWTYETIARNRVKPELVPDMVRVVVAIDPSGGDEDGNSEQGIIVAGKGVDGHGYVLADRSCKLSPAGWGLRSVRAYDEFKADRIVGETNFGGDLVIANVQVAARNAGIEVATKKLTASRGKVARAEPVAALYEQERIHHVGEFEELEEQQRIWTPEAGWSPDRLDALVWAFTELLLVGRDMKPMTILEPTGTIGNPGGRGGIDGGVDIAAGSWTRRGINGL